MIQMIQMIRMIQTIRIIQIIQIIIYGQHFFLFGNIEVNNYLSDFIVLILTISIMDSNK